MLQGIFERGSAPGAVHLYKLNSIFSPQSFVLFNIYENLTKVYN